MTEGEERWKEKLPPVFSVALAAADLLRYVVGLCRKDLQYKTQ